MSKKIKYNDLKQVVEKDDDITIDEIDKDMDENLINKIVYVDEMDLRRLTSEQLSNIRISKSTKNIIKKTKKNGFIKILEDKEEKKDKEYIEKFLNSELNRKKLMNTFGNNKIFFSELLKLIHKIDN